MDEYKFIKNKNIDIKIELVEYKPKIKVIGSKLVLKFTGKDINLGFVNSLRRGCMDLVPIYAIPRELIKIEKNTSEAYSNDVVSFRLSCFNIPNIDNDIIDIVFDKDIIMPKSFKDINRKKCPEEKNIEIFIDKKNVDEDMIYVTSSDFMIKIDNNEINSFDKKYPIPLIELGRGEELILHAKAVLSIGEYNASWYGVRNAFHYKDKDSIILVIRGNEQITELDALIKVIKILTKKIRLFKIRISEDLKNVNDIVVLNLYDENHTLGNILNQEFQNHPNITSSGINKDELLVEKISIIVNAKDKVNPLPYLLESCDKIENKLLHMGKIISEIKIK